MPSYRYTRIGISKGIYTLVERLAREKGVKPTTIIRWAMIVGLERMLFYHFPSRRELYVIRKNLEAWPEEKRRILTRQEKELLKLMEQLDL